MVTKNYSPKKAKNKKVSDKPNLNEISAEKFKSMHVPGFTDSRITSVIDFRDSHGEFKSFDEFPHIPMIGETMVESLKEHFIIEASDTSDDDEEDEEDTSDDD